MRTGALNKWLKAGISTLIVLVLGIMILMASCKPEPDDEGHHRDSPSNYKRY